jgi:hypothetical protein
MFIALTFPVLSCSFGLIQDLLSTCICLDLTNFGLLVEKIMANAETSSMLKFFRLNPWALSQFKSFMGDLFHSNAGSAPREFFMSDKQVRLNTSAVIDQKNALVICSLLNVAALVLFYSPWSISGPGLCRHARHQA